MLELTAITTEKTTMSTNCVQCIKNDRTGRDLLCDDCRNENFEEVMKMDMPCQCDCGKWFDLNDGNPCDLCNKIYCNSCLESPFDTCGRCK